MNTFQNVVGSRWTVTDAQSLWTNRTPVEPLPFDVRGQLLTLSTVRRIGVNLAAYVLQSTCYFMPRKDRHMQDTHTVNDVRHAVILSALVYCL